MAKWQLTNIGQLALDWCVKEKIIDLLLQCNQLLDSFGLDHFVWPSGELTFNGLACVLCMAVDDVITIDYDLSVIILLRRHKFFRRIRHHASRIHFLLSHVQHSIKSPFDSYTSWLVVWSTLKLFGYMCIMQCGWAFQRCVFTVCSLWLNSQSLMKKWVIASIRAVRRICRYFIYLFFCVPFDQCKCARVVIQFEWIRQSSIHIFTVCKDTDGNVT